MGQPFVWGDAQRLAFQSIKSQIERSLQSAYFEVGRPTSVVVDASPVGLSALLCQRDDNGNNKVITCISRALTDTEKLYPQTHKEALACVWACERLDSHLRGAPSFDLITDCKALETM